MNVGYKDYGTCPKVWMIVCMDSNGSPMKEQQKKGCFFFFRTCTQERKNQKQGSPPRFAQGPEAIQEEARCDGRDAFGQDYVVAFLLCAHAHEWVCCRERELAYHCLQCLESI